MKMTEGQKTGVQWLQTLVLFVTVAGVFVTVGRTDKTVVVNSEAIAELREIAGELVKAQVLSSAHSVHHAQLLEDLARRVDRLEFGE